MTEPASPRSTREGRPRTQARGLRRAASQAGLVATLLAVFIVSAAAAGTCSLLLTAGNSRALSAAVAAADGGENDNSPDIVTVDVVAAASETTDTPRPDAASIVPATRRLLAAAADPYPATVSTWAATPMLFIAGADVRCGYLLDADTLPANATLRSGAWPASPPSAHGVIPAAVPATTAAALGATVGSTLRLSLDRNDGQPVAPYYDLVIAGIFDPTGSRAWTRDTLHGRGYDPDYLRLPTFGPFVVPPGTLEARAAPVEKVAAVLDPDLSSGAEGVSALLRHVEGVSEQLGDQAGPGIRPVAVRSALGDTLARMRAQLDVSTALVLAVFLLVFALAVATASLVAGALVARRAGEAALLRDRGASTGQLLRGATVEAGVLAAAAAVLAVPVALAAFSLAAPPPVHSPGPMAGFGETAWLALGLSVVAGAVLPAAVVVVAAAPERARRARQVLAGPVARSGIDIMLAVVAAVAYLQLRAHVVSPGAVDPLLVIAPAVCAVAVAALLTRLVPLLGRLADFAARRGQGVVLPLAGWQVARAGAARGVLLLVLATAVGTLGVAFLGTWSASQEDQAAAAVGADVVIADAPGPGTARLVAQATGGAASPFADRPVVLGSRPGGVKLLAVDATHADTLLRGRLPDGGSWSKAMAGLAPADGGSPLTLAGRSIRLTVTGGVPSRSIGPGIPPPVVGAAPTLVLADDSGYRTTQAGPEVALDGRPHTVRLPLPGPAGLPGDTWHVIAISLHLVSHTTEDLIGWSNNSATMNVRLAIEGASSPGGAWGTAADTGPAMVQPGELSAQVGTVEGWFTFSVLGLSWTPADVTLVSFPASNQVPVTMSQDLAAELGLAPGDRIALNWDTTPVEAVLVRTVPYVPSHVGEAALLADRSALERALLSTGRLDPVSTGWRVASPRPGAAEALRGAGLTAVSSSGEAATEYRDGPLRAPLRSAWVIAIVAAVGLGVTGAAVHASAQAQRRASTIARVRAIGASRGQVLASQLAQHAAVTLLGVTLGTLCGALLAWLLAPLLVLSPDGQRAVPPALLVWPPTGTGAVVGVLLVGALLAGVPAAYTIVRRSTVSALRAGEAL